MKNLTSLLIAVFVVLSLSVTAFAAGGSPKIVDQANILTDSEEAALEAMAQNLVRRYDMDVVILTAETLNGKNITAYADDYFDYNGYGIGQDYSGVLLMLAMDEREWAISTCGNGIAALTDYGQDQIMDEVLEYFSDGEYYRGFTLYLELLDTYFEAYANGAPIDKPVSPYRITVLILVAMIFGLATGYIVISVMKSSMRTAQPQRSARSYVRENSYYLHRQSDVYLYSNTTRVRKSEGSSGGGSSSHRSSSGRSHGGSRGRF